MSNTVSSYIPTSGGVDARALEQLSFTLSAKPQAMTFYVRLIEAGTIVIPSGVDRVLQLGSNSNPRLIIANSANGRYSLRWINADGTLTGNAPAITPEIGDVVELLNVIAASGAVTNSTVVNGVVTAASASDAQVLPTEWSNTTLSVGGVGTTAVGFNNFINICIMRGVQTLGTMRREAGVW